MTKEYIDIELEPAPDPLAKGPGEDQIDIRTYLGRRNLIRLGAPRCDSYLHHVQREGAPLSADAQALIKGGYTLRRIRPTMTVLPGSACAFITAELSIELTGQPAETGATVASPIAYSVEPAEIVEEDPFSRTSKTTREVGAQTGNEVAKVLAKVSHEDAVLRDGVQYVRRLYSYGVNFSEVGWRLRATPNHELAGDITALEVVVQVPPNATLTGRFRVAAEIAVQSASDRWLTRAFVPRGGSSLEVVYQL